MEALVPEFISFFQYILLFSLKILQNACMALSLKKALGLLWEDRSITAIRNVSFFNLHLVFSSPMLLPIAQFGVCLHSLPTFWEGT